MRAVITAAFNGKEIPEEEIRTANTPMAEEMIHELPEPPAPVPATPEPMQIPPEVLQKTERTWRFFSDDGRNSLTVGIKLIPVYEPWKHDGAEVQGRRIYIYVKGFAHPFMQKAAVLDGYGFGGIGGDKTRNPALYPVAQMINEQLERTLMVKMAEHGLDKILPKLYGGSPVKTQISGNDKLFQQVDFNLEIYAQEGNVQLAKDEDILRLLVDVVVRMTRWCPRLSAASRSMRICSPRQTPMTMSCASLVIICVTTPIWPPWRPRRRRVAIRPCNYPASADIRFPISICVMT
jgi:hypothetical protein